MSSLGVSDPIRSGRRGVAFRLRFRKYVALSAMDAGTLTINRKKKRWVHRS